MAAKKIPAAPALTGDNDPSLVTPEIQALREHARLSQTLMGGTRAMRAAGQLFLPKMRQERDEVYADRLKTTVLRNFYRSTLSTLAGKLVRNGITVDASAPAPKEMEGWFDDLDCCGTPADVLAKRLFVWSIRDACTFILTDYPPTGGGQTLADEREQGIRPWMIPLTINDTLGIRRERRGGREVITQFRYVMHTQEDAGMFGVKPVETVRVVEESSIRDYRKNAKGKWEIVNEYVNTLGRVALQRVASDMDDDCSRPRGGMNELAWLNLEHWQIRSDQRMALRIGAFPILFGSGMESLPPIGPQEGICASDPQAKMVYVEHNGTALAAGRQELLDLEDAMRAMSAQFQAKQVAPKTATETAIDANEAISPAQGWALNLKRAMEGAMDDMAEFAGKGKGPGAGGKLALDTDALVSSLDSSKLAALQAARTAGEISRKTFLAALVKADVLPQDFDAEADQEELDDEPVEETAGLNKPPPKR